MHLRFYLIALGTVDPEQAFAELTPAFRNAGRPGSLALVVDAQEHDRITKLEDNEHFRARDGAAGRMESRLSLRE